MWKVPIAGLDPAERLHIKTDKQYMLFGGTKILQHTSDKGGKLRTPDGGCLAVVLRTGFETAQARYCALVAIGLHVTLRLHA